MHLILSSHVLAAGPEPSAAGVREGRHHIRHLLILLMQSPYHLGRSRLRDASVRRVRIIWCVHVVVRLRGCIQILGCRLRDQERRRRGSLRYRPRRRRSRLGSGSGPRLRLADGPADLEDLEDLGLGLRRNLGRPPLFGLRCGQTGPGQPSLRVLERSLAYDEPVDLVHSWLRCDEVLNTIPDSGAVGPSAATIAVRYYIGDLACPTLFIFPRTTASRAAADLSACRTCPCLPDTFYKCVPGLRSLPVRSNSLAESAKTPHAELSSAVGRCTRHHTVQGLCVLAAVAVCILEGNRLLTHTGRDSTDTRRWGRRVPGSRLPRG